MSENLILIRNILYRWFIIGFLFLGFSSLMYILAKDFTSEIAYSMFKLETEDYHRMMVYFLGSMKVILFMFILAPALAIHSLVRK